ncbi:hypothetical protein GCM10011575_44390 [Microlunatus endophyticus]|uniref:DUF559 domain-containing protein n=1 Tax=Microlunatus endophyticus TaxID=1716077 RepID=A0A917SGW5_9ACTN|nr:DUF559 domain-containing protein [Microlunatus endophyticus]GGL81214.1 hypothetical protein GCM10011575_44390 [Microlunatus endophyticus]
MRTIHRERLAQLLAEGGGVVRRSEHPELGPVLDRLLRTKELTTVLLGIYAPAGFCADLAARMAAVAAWNADAVVVGRAAAAATYWPDIRFDRVDIVLRVARKLRSMDFRLHRRTIPVDWIRELRVGTRTVRVSAPALTAVELAAELGGEPIDTVLRTRQATLDDMRSALDAVSGSRGNGARRRLLWESRDTPWAESERLAHQLLRDAAILGWTGNEKVVINGHTYFVDICFLRLKIAVEIDGRDHQRDITTFVRDRERQNALVLAGWIVLRFTWQDLDRHPQRFVAQVRAAIETASRATAVNKR